MSRLQCSLVGACAAAILLGVAAQYEWQVRDAFDEIRIRINKVNADNCPITHLEDLYLPEDSVSHHPDVKDINVNPVYPNRTALLHLHNMAINRAFFWSYILQSRFIRPAINDTYDPGMMYYFLSTVADVSANPYINASAIYFSPNMSYTSSFRGFFNKTMPRFAPRTFRADDFNDPVHLQKISTMNTFTSMDLGAISMESLSDDYTTDYYRINEWYGKWLPDHVQERHDTKTIYQVEIRYANNTNETFTFHGPPANDEIPGPVNWTRPYFDCGRSNKWLVAAVSPIVDIYPRHTQFRHIEYPTYTAAIVMEMDYDRLDINQCPPSPGNDKPNRFADTARCKNETTECEPLHGWGYRRGGYQCRCRPGFRLPSIVRRPYLGEIIERATADQYYNNFDCSRIGWIQKLPMQWEKAHPFIRYLYMDRYFEYINATTGPESLHTERMNIDQVMRFIHGVQPSNCTKYNPHDLHLNGDIAWGAEEQFQNEAKMAVRLANFISAFLQVSDPKEVFSGKRVADPPLTEDQMIGETLAIVLGNSKVWSAGTYWDRNKFTNRSFFAPFAYKEFEMKELLNTRHFKLEDLARLNKTDEVYTNKPWFQFLKQRWSTNFDSLEKYFLKMKIRFNETGEYLKKHERYPTYYRAANLDHGHWTTPYFDCDGHVKKWLIMYASPFFGWDSVKVKLEFKGVVAVTMDLLSLDINQCPDKYYVPNAFKGTDKCDRRTSYCVPILGRGFEIGGYKCECLQGYEYPFEDLITYYDGQIVEAEFMNIVQNKETRLDMFKCRLAGAAAVQSSFTLLLIIVMILFKLRQEWEKVNITDNENGTLSFHYKRSYTFRPELSAGPDDDAVVVPNIPMLSATSQSKHAARFLRLAMASIMDILKIKPFVEVSVGQLLWGYEDPLLKLAKDVVPKEQKLPYEEFGLLYGKNATSPDVVTMFTGADDITKYGMYEWYNNRDRLPHWTTDQCNSIRGGDGSIFPPHLTRNTTLHVYDKDLCRLLPLTYLRDVDNPAGISGYRFTPPEDVFAADEHNRCFCPAGPPCAPAGLFNVSLCQYDSPIMLSFPHFYLADESLRQAVEGMREPDAEKDRLFIDVQPEMGIAMRARARIQINLAVSQVIDIKQVANFPDIVFPILWFEEGIDELPNEVASLLRLATKVPPIARLALGWGLSALGILLILLAVTCLIRSSHRQSTLRLQAHAVANPTPTKFPQGKDNNGYEMNSRR